MTVNIISVQLLIDGASRLLGRHPWKWFCGLIWSVTTLGSAALCCFVFWFVVCNNVYKSLGPLIHIFCFRFCGSCRCYGLWRIALCCRCWLWVGFVSTTIVLACFNLTTAVIDVIVISTLLLLFVLLWVCASRNESFGMAPLELWQAGRFDITGIGH